MSSPRSSFFLVFAFGGALMTGEDIDVSRVACHDGATPLRHRFASGAEWQMCWKIDPHQGLVLQDIAYTAPGKPPLAVIAELALSQLEVPYDTGRRRMRDVTEQGFGGRNMRTLMDGDCIGERVAVPVANYGTGAVGGSEVRPVLCREEVDAGLGRRSTWGGRPISQRARSLELSTVSVVGWYEYVSLYRFTESGEIQPRLGATGDLSPEDYTDEAKWGSPVGAGTHERAVSHSHNAVWRVHWSLAGTQRVEEYNADFSGEQGPLAAIMNGTWTPLDHETTRRRQSRRWWLVRGAGKNDDGHPISYRIQDDALDDYAPHGADTSGHGDVGFGYDVAFSQFNPCELYATQNLLAGCSTNDVPSFVAEHAALDDVVSWVAVSYHHVPRDEDQSPMDVHWQGFAMTPFGALARNPLAPRDRANVNGKPAPDDR